MVSKIFKAANEGDQVLFQQLVDEVELKAKQDYGVPVVDKRTTMGRHVDDIADIMEASPCQKGFGMINKTWERELNNNSNVSMT